MPDLQVTYDARRWIAPEVRWQEATQERGHWYVREDHWPVSAEDLASAPLPRSGTLSGFSSEWGNQRAFVEFPDAVAFLLLMDGHLVASVASASPGRSAQLLSEFRELFPEPEIDEEARRLPIVVWHHTDYGARSTRREIEISPWEDIATNYAGATRHALGELMQMSLESGSGQLVLWHGSPGSGKTFAIRALGWALRRKAELHYIVDPETLLGAKPEYLTEVVLDTRTKEGLWRVFVLEDSGELLGLDAKARTGQALSRLLNITDGLLGQDLRFIILVTTNEHLSDLHPAVARPGRCRAVVEFQDLRRKEAACWLEGHGAADLLPRLPQRGVSLAELYSLTEGASAGLRAPNLASDRLPIGFAPSGRQQN